MVFYPLWKFKGQIYVSLASHKECVHLRMIMWFTETDLKGHQNTLTWAGDSACLDVQGPGTVSNDNYDDMEVFLKTCTCY